jgi:signal transduction histidine kinase
MLRLELTETTHPRAALMVKGVQTGIGRLRELIEDMIEVSLIDSGLLKLEYQPVWLLRMIDIAVSEAYEAASIRRLMIDVKSETLPSRPTVGDPERLLKAFQKVLANAIKYTPDGGKITVSGCERPGYVDLRVEDTGIGIAPENLERIFEKFSNIGDPTRHSSGKVKYKAGGAGLGLMIAKGVLEAHGGTIWAESPGCDEEKHPGSCFHLMIPLRNVTSGEGMSPLVATAASTLSRGLPGPKPAAIVTVDRPTVEETKGAAAALGDANQGAGEVRAQPVSGDQPVADHQSGSGVEAGEGQDRIVSDTVLPS